MYILHGLNIFSKVIGSNNKMIIVSSSNNKIIIVPGSDNKMIIVWKETHLPYWLKLLCTNNKKHYVPGFFFLVTKYCFFCSFQARIFSQITFSNLAVLLSLRCPQPSTQQGVLAQNPNSELILDGQWIGQCIYQSQNSLSVTKMNRMMKQLFFFLSDVIAK